MLSSGFYIANVVLTDQRSVSCYIFIEEGIKKRHYYLYLIDNLRKKKISESLVNFIKLKMKRGDSMTYAFSSRIEFLPEECIINAGLLLYNSPRLYKYNIRKIK